MKHKTSHGIFGVLILILTALTGFAADLPARTFSHPDRIRYDAQCLTIDGKDIFIYSGAFHYFRCPKELWRDRSQKIKDAGFNCVETYVAWNYCEQEMPASMNDFSKINLTDLDDFLKMAEDFGLYVIVRPGPYICAEWDTGGYPQWLLAKKPDAPLRSQGWLRSDDPVYLAWCKHWYDAVCPVIAKHQITRKSLGASGVILVQVENEYDFGPHFSDDVKLNQVKALAGDARAAGIDVPLITCWTHQVRGSADPLLRQIFDACNFYPRWDVDSTRKDIDKLRSEQPDAPLATTELQGGWFSKVGDKLSDQQDGITASQINNITLFAIQNGETILNYYMLFGGSNLGDWAARDLTTTYDYNAPIRESGGVGDRYQRVWALGHFLQEHGAKLARSENVACEVSVPQKDVTVVERRAQDGGRYFFIRTSQHDEPREGTATVNENSGGTNEIVFNYKLEPFGATVLYLPAGAANSEQGEWLPKAAPAIERPTDLPPSVTITSARSRDDSVPSHWTKIKPGQNLAQAGIYDSRFIFYRTKISSRTETNLLVEYPDGDAVLATINGKSVDRVGGTLGSSVFDLPKGSSKVQFLYENRGFPNGGDNMEQQGGISAMQFTASAFGEGQAIGGWRMHDVDGTSKRPEVKTNFDDSGWSPVAVDGTDTEQLTPNRTAVFRAGIELAQNDLNGGKLLLNFWRVDDLGWVYVNGKSVGKTTDWSHPFSFDVTKELHPGHNIIAVIVKNTGGGGGIAQPTLVRRSEGTSVKLESFASPTGVEEQWWKPDFNDRHWKSVPITASTAGDSLLTWYRMKFELQPAKSGVWVPWGLHLTATGNGFLYLNGHALGRYWEAGPQHDFFLPECWLNFGDGKTNNLTLSLRSTENVAAIQSATVEPYSEFAEKR